MGNHLTLKAILKANYTGCLKEALFLSPDYQLYSLSEANSPCTHEITISELRTFFIFGSSFLKYTFLIILLKTNFKVWLYSDNDAAVRVYIFSAPIVFHLLFLICFRYSVMSLLHPFGGIQYKPAV